MTIRVFALLLGVVVTSLFAMVMSRHREATLRWLAKYAAPIMMAFAYFLLIITSDTDNYGKLWMTGGFGFVLIIWVVIYTLATRAALSRALAVGDIEQILRVTDRELAKDNKPRERTQLLIARAFAHELQGDHATVVTGLAGLDDPSARARRARALVELGRLADARREIDALPVMPPPATLEHAIVLADLALARGRVLVAEGKPAAKQELQAIVSNVRATVWQRETAAKLLAALKVT